MVIVELVRYTLSFFVRVGTVVKPWVCVCVCMKLWWLGYSIAMPCMYCMCVCVRACFGSDGIWCVFVDDTWLVGSGVM